MDAASVFDITSVLELFVRGTLIYLGLTLFLRFVGQRESGSLSITDIMVIVLLSEAVSHAFAPESTSVTDAFILVATILGWSVALDALSFRFPAVARVLKPSKRPLIEDGKVDERRLRRELMTRSELEVQLRLQGIRSIDEVAAAYLEPNGMISAFRKEDGASDPTPKPSDI